MIPIVVCTIGSPTLSVLRASVEAYAQEHELIVFENTQTTFGEAYNTALNKVFKEYDEIIIANDDVVLLPTTMQRLLTDVQRLKDGIREGKVNKIGFVGTMADNVRPSQNIRLPFMKDESIVNSRWQSEDLIKLVPVIAPIFAYFSKEAFTAAQFPPIDWFSDDVICEDLQKLGFQHFVSSSYVHHVGAHTIGNDYEKLREAARPWIEKNRPEYIQELYVNRLGLQKQKEPSPYVNGLENPMGYKLKYGA